MVQGKMGGDKNKDDVPLLGRPNQENLAKHSLQITLRGIEKRETWKKIVINFS